VGTAPAHLQDDLRGPLHDPKRLAMLVLHHSCCVLGRGVKRSEVNLRVFIARVEVSGREDESVKRVSRWIAPLGCEGCQDE
jgi:hypothetical protein